MKCATEAEPFFSPAGAQYDSPGQGGPSRRRPGCPASMSYEGLKGRRNTQHGARHRVPFHYIALSGLTTCRATLTQGCALGYRTVGPTGLLKEPFFSPHGARYDSPGQGGPSRRRPGYPANMSFPGLKGRRKTEHGARHRAALDYGTLSGLAGYYATPTQGCALGYRTVGPTGLHNILAKDGKPLGVGERAIWGLV